MSPPPPAGLDSALAPYTRLTLAVGRKCTKYEMNYHSSKGELAALNFALENYKYLVLQGPFLVRIDNTTVLHWETTKDPGGTIRR